MRKRELNGVYREVPLICISCSSLFFLYLFVCMCAEKVFYEVAYVCRCVRVIMRSIACNSLLSLLYYESVFFIGFTKKKNTHTRTHLLDMQCGLHMLSILPSRKKKRRKCTYSEEEPITEKGPYVRIRVVRCVPRLFVSSIR